MQKNFKSKFNYFIKTIPVNHCRIKQLEKLIIKYREKNPLIIAIIFFHSNWNIAVGHHIIFAQ